MDIPVGMHIYIYIHTQTCLHAYLPTCLPTYIFLYIYMYMHTHIHRFVGNPTEWSYNIFRPGSMAAKAVLQAPFLKHTMPGSY